MDEMSHLIFRNYTHVGVFLFFPIKKVD